MALPVPWAMAEAWGGLGIAAEWVAAMAGLSILGAAFMLSWACELAEREIPQAMALLLLALMGVLPEYAVDLHFAWVAGKDPTYAGYAVANMTGANRLLIGLGWAMVVRIAAPFVMPVCPLPCSLIGAEIGRVAPSFHLSGW